MSDFLKDWGNVWNKSILSFTKAKRALVPQLEAVWKGSPGLIKSLDIIDKNDATTIPANKPKEIKAAIALITKEFKNLQKEKVKYATVIDNAIKNTDKETHKECYRDLKLLRAHLDWVEKAVGNQVALQSKEVQKADAKVRESIDKESNRLREEGKGDEEVKVGVQFLKFVKLLVAFPTAAKTAAALAAKAVQAIKSDPTVLTYNHEMDRGGRNYTQQLNNVISLARHPECPADLKDLLRGLMGYEALLKDFGGEAKRQAPQDADKDDVLALAKEYSALVKDTVGYVDVVTKYIAKNKKKLGLK